MNTVDFDRKPTGGENIALFIGGLLVWVGTTACDMWLWNTHAVGAFPSLPTLDLAQVFAMQAVLTAWRYRYRNLAVTLEARIDVLTQCFGVYAFVLMPLGLILHWLGVWS